MPGFYLPGLFDFSATDAWVASVQSSDLFGIIMPAFSSAHLLHH